MNYEWLWMMMIKRDNIWRRPTGISIFSHLKKKTKKRKTLGFCEAQEGAAIGGEKSRKEDWEGEKVVDVRE